MTGSDLTVVLDFLRRGREDRIVFGVERRTAEYRALFKHERSPSDRRAAFALTTIDWVDRQIDTARGLPEPEQSHARHALLGLATKLRDADPGTPPTETQLRAIAIEKSVLVDQLSQADRLDQRMDVLSAEREKRRALRRRKY